MSIDRFISRIDARRDPSKEGWQQLEQLFDTLSGVAVAYQPQGVGYRTRTVGQVPVEVFTPPAAQGYVLLLHGGNYRLRLIDAYRTLAQEVALKASKTVVLVDYAICPYVYPDALAEVYTVWQWIMAKDDRISLWGDGSGANMALQLALALRDEGARMPKGMVLLSPQTDMTASGDSYYDNYYLDVLYGKKKLGGQDVPDAFRASPMWAYLGELDPASPEASPLFADLGGLPPMFVAVGSHEVLLSDATRLVDKAQKAGVDATLTVGEGLFYAYPMFHRQLDEARVAFGAACAFLRNQ